MDDETPITEGAPSAPPSPESASGSEVATTTPAPAEVASTPSAAPAEKPHGYRMSRLAAARKTPWAPVLIVVLALITIAGLAIAYRSFSARVEASQKIDNAKSLIERADDVIVEIDEVVLAEVTPELADEAVAVQRKAPRAKSDLQKAIALLEEAQPDAGDRDRELVALLLDTATSRIAMLDAADQILPVNIAASRALTPARKGWDALLDADEASDKAVASYNKLTRAAVTESSKLNKRAAVLLGTAQTEFKTAEQQFSGAPFEQYLTYIDGRQSLNKLSQQSDAAWLKGDIAKANDLIKQYNVGDKKSVELAKTLPEAPEKAIADSYTEAATGPTDDYYAAREEATSADERLKAF